MSVWASSCALFMVGGTAQRGLAPIAINPCRYTHVICDRCISSFLVCIVYFYPQFLLNMRTPHCDEFTILKDDFVLIIFGNQYLPSLQAQLLKFPNSAFEMITLLATVAYI